MSDIVKSLRINGEAWSNEASRDWYEAEHFITLAKVQSRLQHDAADHITALEAELSRVEAELAEAVGLLKPFAEAEECIGEPDWMPDTSSCVFLGSLGLNVGHIRAARSFLTRMEASHDRT